MKAFICRIIFLLPLVVLGEVDSIYLWNNNQRERREANPTVASLDTLVYVAWEDLRWGNGRSSVFRQRVYWNGVFGGYNVEVDTDNVWDINNCSIDIEANPANFLVHTWERIVTTNKITRDVQVYARILSNNRTIEVDTLYEEYHKSPSISCRDNGEFVISYTLFYPPQQQFHIYHKKYSNDGTLQREDYIRFNLMMRGFSHSYVAFCDSGYVVVYEDSASGDSLRSIYLQYRNILGNVVKPRIKVSRPLSDGHNEVIPHVAVNRQGFVVVVWTYFFNESNPDIYARTFQMRSNDLIPVSSGDFPIVESNDPESNPKVAVFPNNDFLVVYTKRISDYGVYGRAIISGTPKIEFVVHDGHSPCNYDQFASDISCRGSDTLIVAWNDFPDTTASGAYLTRRIFTRCYYRYPESPYGVNKYPGDTIIDPTPPQSGLIWYYDDENYDNPATPDWDEDPIDEPDSVFTSIDSALIDQYDEFNQVNDRYRLTVLDTLPGNQKGLSYYDNIIVDLGFRINDCPAGIISANDQNTLVQYIESGKPVLLMGTDFGYLYSGTTLFSKFHARYVSDGNPNSVGNIDTLYGVAGTFARNETLAYQYREPPDNYVDVIDTTDGGKFILRSWSAKDRWYYGRAVGWGNYWKKDGRTDGSTIYCSFASDGIKDRHHPHTFQEFQRRCLGFLKMQCPPEPITTLTADTTGCSEGCVKISWKVVSDDSLGESAEGSYKLKFSRSKIESEDAFDSVETYYQTWNTKDSTVGVPVTYTLYGLPPMDTLIFALKVSDENTLWGALGSEPRAVVAGDSVTPHTITFGDNYVKDFSNKYEYINRRRKNDTGSDYDSLFVTWDSNWFEFGFARCSLNTEGDLFIYVDTKSGGADSTVPYNGSSGRSGFVSDFRPDYCLIIENATIRRYSKWVTKKDGRGSWNYVDSGGTYVMEDSIVNNYLYTEGYIRFDTMAYTSSNPFKFVVLMTEERTNKIINAFPIFNPLGTGVYITQYYYSSGLLSNRVPNRDVQIIGIEEAPISKTEIRSQKFEVQPNPFREKALIILPELDVPPQDISLKIYDVSGRLVKQFNHSTIQPFNRVFWDGTDDNGRKLARGIYFCELAIPEKGKTIKIIYLK